MRVVVLLFILAAGLAIAWPSHAEDTRPLEVRVLELQQRVATLEQHASSALKYWRTPDADVRTAVDRQARLVEYSVKLAPLIERGRVSSERFLSVSATFSFDGTSRAARPAMISIDLVGAPGASLQWVLDGVPVAEPSMGSLNEPRTMEDLANRAGHGVSVLQSIVRAQVVELRSEEPGSYILHVDAIEAIRRLLEVAGLQGARAK